MFSSFKCPNFVLVVFLKVSEHSSNHLYLAALQRIRLLEIDQEVSSVIAMLGSGHVARPDLLQARLHIFQALDILNLGLNVVPPSDNNIVNQG